MTVLSLSGHFLLVMRVVLEVELRRPSNGAHRTAFRHGVSPRRQPVEIGRHVDTAKPLQRGQLRELGVEGQIDETELRAEPVQPV